MAEEKPLTRSGEYLMLSNIKGLMMLFLVVYHFASGKLYDLGDAVASANLGISLVAGMLVFIFICAVPMYVFIAGYGSKNTAACRETAFTSFFVPYIILSVVMIIEYTAFNQKLQIDVFEPLVQLWFFLAMFIWMIMLKDVLEIKFIIPISIVLALAVGLVFNYQHFTFTFSLDTFFALARVVALFPFLIVGAKLTRNNLDMIRSSKAVKTVSVVSFVLFSTIALFISMNTKWLGINSILSMKCDYSYLHYFNFDGGLTTYEGVNIAGLVTRIVFFIICAVFIVAVLSLMPAKRIPFITRLGENSLAVFSLHEFIVLPIVYIMSLLSLPLWLFMILSVVLSIGTCSVLSINAINKAYNSLIFKIGTKIKKK